MRCRGWCPHRGLHTLELGEMPARVLVVLGDEEDRGPLQALLAGGGYEVEAVASATQARKAIGRSCPSVLLVCADLEGDTDGIALVKDLRSRPETTRCAFIVLAQARDLARGVEALEAGADDYVLLPANAAELLARVGAHLRARQRPPVETADLTRRAAVLERVAAIGAGDAAGAIASAAAAAAMGLPGAVGATVVVLDEPGRAHPLAAAGGSLPSTLPSATELWARAGGGAWVQAAMPPDVGWLAFAPLVSPAGVASIAAPPLALLGVRFAPDAIGDDDPGAAVLAAVLDVAGALRPTLAPALIGRDGFARQRLDLDLMIAEPDQAFWPVFQPVFDVRERTPRIAGYEALTRFDDGMPPSQRFATATRVGRGHELELAAVALAVDAATNLPPVGWLRVNMSPRSVLAGGDAFAAVLKRADRVVVVEITDHEDVDDYDELHAALHAIHPRPLLSIDDAGSGYTTFQHVLRMAPDFVKLDVSWVRDVDTDPPRQALVSCLAEFADGIGAQLVAEGVERPGELETLRRLGVGLAQGWLLGEPASSGEASGRPASSGEASGRPAVIPGTA